MITRVFCRSRLSQRSCNSSSAGLIDQRETECCSSSKARSSRRMKVWLVAGYRFVRYAIFTKVSAFSWAVPTSDDVREVRKLS